MKSLYESILNVDLDATTDTTAENVRIIGGICRAFIKNFDDITGHFKNESEIRQRRDMGGLIECEMKLGGGRWHYATAGLENADLIKYLDRFIRDVNKVLGTDMKHRQLNRFEYAATWVLPLFGDVFGDEYFQVRLRKRENRKDGPTLIFPANVLFELPKYR